MAVVSAGELRNRVEVLRRTGRINPLGEQTYDYETERRVWAKIVPTAGRGETVEGDMERAEVTHRITVRRASIPNPDDGPAASVPGAGLRGPVFLPQLPGQRFPGSLRKAGD